MFTSLKDEDIKELQRIVSEFSKSKTDRAFINLDPVYGFSRKRVLLNQQF